MYFVIISHCVLGFSKARPIGTMHNSYCMLLYLMSTTLYNYTTPCVVYITLYNHTIPCVVYTTLYNYAIPCVVYTTLYNHTTPCSIYHIV